MTTIEQLPEINRLADQHDDVRARLADVRNGATVALRIRLEHDDPPGDDYEEHLVELARDQAESALLGILSGVRARLKGLGVFTPEPPAIVVAEREQVRDWHESPSLQTVVNDHFGIEERA